MARFRFAFLTSIALASGACAESTAPGRMLDADASEHLSGAPRYDSTVVSISSETDDPVARDGGNVMGGGGR